jgi:hypothetical protein
MPHVLPRTRRTVQPITPMVAAVQPTRPMVAAVQPISPMVAAAVAVAAVMTLAPAVEAGPPLVCHPFETGSAPLLPWSGGPGWNRPDRSYDVQRLTADTLRLLSPDAPVLARMENLRRATIYAARDRQVAAELLSAVLGRALEAAAEGGRDPLAWFDAGYLIESYRQADSVFHRDAPPAASDPLRGYRLVLKAMELAGSNPEMEYAASLMKEGPASAEHLRRATSGAKAGSLLARNLSR